MKVLYANLIAQLKMLYTENWSDLPRDYDLLYGEDEIVALAERFNVETRATARGFREFKEIGRKTIPEGLKPLFMAVHMVPVCTAECKRGFSHMNLIISPKRNCLSVSTAVFYLLNLLDRH